MQNNTIHNHRVARPSPLLLGASAGATVKEVVVVTPLKDVKAPGGAGYGGGSGGSRFGGRYNMGCNYAGGYGRSSCGGG